jgi:hypothetical protein
VYPSRPLCMKVRNLPQGMARITLQRSQGSGLQVLHDLPHVKLQTSCRSMTLHLQLARAACTASAA